MKYLFSLLLVVSALAANGNNLICSQLHNNTRLPFHYDIGKTGFHLNKGDTSPIIGFEDTYRYRLLDGTISVYRQGVQITKNGRFSMHTENIKVSSRHHCEVTYLIQVYD